jgi:hypothetical protein
MIERCWTTHGKESRLRESNLAVLDVAERAGYRIEAAFNRAFKRHEGTARALPAATSQRVVVTPVGRSATGLAAGCQFFEGSHWSREVFASLAPNLDGTSFAY